MLKKIKKLTNKITVIMVSLLLLFNSYCHADIVQEVSGGGEIQNSKLAQGTQKIIVDLTGTFKWIIPFLAIAITAFLIIKMMMGDENDRQRYKKWIITELVLLILSFSLVSLTNLLAKYFI